MSYNSSNELIRILIVDDEPAAARMMQAALSVNYDCRTVCDPLAAMDEAAQFAPHIIVLDIHMPAMDGYQLCKQFKQKESTEQPVILFISGYNTLEKRLQAFDVGGDDFIAKPFEVVELQRKVSRLSEFVVQRKQNQNLQITEKVAAESMKLAAEYGNVMACFKSMFYVNSVSELADTFFYAMDRFGLKSSLMINDEERHFFDYQHDRISPIEHSIYEKLHNQGRLYQFGKRMIVNDLHLSFIVKNMPEDEVDAGHIRDYCAALIEGLSARYIAIKKQAALSKVVDKLNDSISILEAGLHLQAQSGQNILTNISEKLTASFHILDLNEAQEQHLTDLIEQELAGLDDVKGMLTRLNEGLQNLREEANSANKISFSSDNLSTYQNKDIDLELF